MHGRSRSTRRRRFGEGSSWLAHAGSHCGGWSALSAPTGWAISLLTIIGPSAALPCRLIAGPLTVSAAFLLAAIL